MFALKEPITDGYSLLSFLFITQSHKILKKQTRVEKCTSQQQHLCLTKMFFSYSEMIPCLG